MPGSLTRAALSSLVPWLVCSTPAPLLAQAQQLPSVNDVPLATFGDAHDLFEVRGLAFLDDGLVVADGGSKRLLHLTLSGELTRALGAAGQGPGEFTSIRAIDVCDGRIVAWDPALDRVTVFGGEGRVETFSLPPRGDRHPQELSCEATRLLVSYRVSGAGEAVLGPYRPTFELHQFSLSGRHQRALGEMPGDERYRHETGDGPRLYGRTTQVVALDDGYLVGPAESFTLNEYDYEGRLRRTYEASVPERPLGPDELTAIADRHIAAAEPYGAEVVRRLRDNLATYEYPSTLPPYSKALVDDERRLWVRHFRAALDHHETWEVFDRTSGRHLGRVELPRDFRLLAVSRGIAAGIWRDALDVEHVRLYEAR